MYKRQAGDEVMRFAYALREKLNERSGQVQEMTEKLSLIHI